MEPNLATWLETDPEYAKKVDESNERMKKALRDYMDEKVLEMLREKDGTESSNVA